MEKQKLHTFVKKYADEHSTEYFILDCIDYRFVDILFNYLDTVVDITNQYDDCALAGASLAPISSALHPKQWRTTFDDNLEIALELHGVTSLFVFDHMDCGAYALRFGEMTRKEEKKKHKEILTLFGKRYKNFKGYKLHIEKYLIDVDGTILQLKRGKFIPIAHVDD